MGVIGFCIILCCVLIPVAAMNAGERIISAL
jgi:hypothetical protein